MKPTSRFIAAIIATAKHDTTRLPFQRGAPRAEMIARRDTPKPTRQFRVATRA